MSRHEGREGPRQDAVRTSEGGPVWTNDGLHDHEIAGFVYEGDPSVERIVATARSMLEERTTYKSFPQARGSGPDGRRLAAEAIYDALKEKYHLSYAKDRAFDSNTRTQQIRLPCDIVGIKGGLQGTCVDLVLLYLSCLAQVELRPIYVHVSGQAGDHALAAFWVEGRPRDELEEPEQWPFLAGHELLDRFERGRIIVLDCTGFGGGYPGRKTKLSFHQACTEGTKWIELMRVEIEGRGAVERPPWGLDIREAWDVGVAVKPDCSASGRGAGPLFTVPFRPHDGFVGRDEDLKALHEMLSPADAKVGIRPTGLVGLGGIGKTQLAAEYAHRYKDQYSDGIYWLNAAEPLSTEFATLAGKLELVGPDKPLERAAWTAWRWLDGLEHALVVYDNVEDPRALNVECSKGLVPGSLRCRILFTTRQRDFPRSFEAFEVDLLSEEAAMELLLRRARPEVLKEHHPEWGRARILCASLGWLPLALELAGAYLEAWSEVTVAGYLERLRTEGQLDTVDDTDVQKQELPTRHEASVKATLQTHWERLAAENDEEARLVFRAAAQFPEASWLPTARLGLVTGIGTLPASAGRPAPIRKVLKRLHRFSLIEKLEGERLRLHPLLHAFGRGLTEPEPASVEQFQALLGEHVAEEMDDLERLEGHVIKRGVDAVVQDLRYGLAFASRRDGAGYGTRSSLEALERVLDRESCHLRPWQADRLTLTARFLQQLQFRARSLGLHDLAHKVDTVLASRSDPYFRLEWRTGEAGDLSQLRMIEGHGGRVDAVAITPDGRKAVSASSDRTLRIWDVATGREERVLNGHAAEVCAVAVTPDGQRVVSGSRDDTLRVWDLDTGRVERVLRGHRGPIHAVRVTPDGQKALSGSSDETMRLWDLGTGSEERVLRGHVGSVYALVVTVDGRRAVSGGQDNILRVWDLETGSQERVLEGHSGPVYTLSLTRDEGIVVSGSHDATLRLWDLEGGEIGHFWLRRSVEAVALASGARSAVWASWDGVLRVNSLRAEELAKDYSSHVGVLGRHADRITSLALTPDRRRLISGCQDGTLRVWDIATPWEKQGYPGEIPGTLTGGALEQPSPVTALAVTLDGSLACSVSGRSSPHNRNMIYINNERSLRTWDLATGQQSAVLRGHTLPVTVVAAGPQETAVVSGSRDGTLRVWGQVSRPDFGPPVIEGASTVTSVAVAPEARTAVSGAWNNNALTVWDLETGSKDKVLPGHTRAIHTVAVTRDGRRAVSGSWDKTIRVWDLIKGEEIFVRDLGSRPVDVGITPDGHKAVFACSGSLPQVWDLERRREGFALQSKMGKMHQVTALLVTLDGQTVTSTFLDGTIRIWSLDTGEQLAGVNCEEPLSCLAGDLHGTTIVAGGDLGHIYRFTYREGTRPARSKTIGGVQETVANHALMPSLVARFLSIVDRWLAPESLSSHLRASPTSRPPPPAPQTMPSRSAPRHRYGPDR